MSELRLGWIRCSLNDVLLDHQPGFACGKKDVQDGLRHLRMNNIGVNGKLNLELVRTVPRSFAGQTHYLNKGDILICTTNSGKLVGKCAPFDLDGEFAFSNHLTKLRPNSAVESKYLHYQLWLRWKEGAFEHKCKHWVNQSTLPKAELLSTDILLAPRNEQRRIVAKLDKVLSRVNVAQERLAIIPHFLKRFRQSILTAACSGQLTDNWRGSQGWSNRNNPSKGVPHTWSKAKLSDVAGVVDPNPSHRYPSYENGCIPILSTQEFSGLDNWDISTAKLVPMAFYEERNNTSGFCADDIVFARKGRLGLARRPPKIPRYTFSHTIFLVRANERVSSDYLLWYLRQDACVSWLVTEMNSNTGVPTLGKAFLQRLPIKLPPRDEQEEIVRRVQALFKTADLLEARYLKAKAHIDKLTQSILARTFRGELVLQDPNDEPASALLERITSERNGSVAVKRRNRK